MLKSSGSMAEFLRSSRSRAWLSGLLLVAATFLAYLPVFRGQFVWDDDAWTTNIGGLLRNVSGLRLIWCQFTALQQYYPLTATTFWLDYHLWGFWPLPYHVENVLLHTLAALLFWRLLKHLGVAGAWLAAAIFALHPVMVESAGWITERKNVLSLVLYIGALLAYGRFNGFWQADAAAAVPKSAARSRRGHYTVALFLFLGALLAKTTAFSLPAVVLLIGWWKGGRLRWRAEVLPTVPFFVLSFGMCLATAWLEKNHVMAQGPDFALTFPERCLIAGRAPWFYTGQLLWPSGLCFIYQRWPLNAGSWQQWLYPATAVGALLALWLARKRIGRGPAAAAFFFAGTLFPALGFMNAYGMRYSFVWDHWVYLSSLGPIALAAALVARAAKHFRAPAVLYGFAAIVLPVQAILTWQQCRMFADAETLWRTTISRNPDAWLAYDNFGIILSKTGQADEAIAYFQKALAIHPGNSLAHNNLGLALFQKGRMDQAIEEFQKALALQPENDPARNNLGQAFLAKGQEREAMMQFQKVLERNPRAPKANYNLGIVLMQEGRVDEAVVHFQNALDGDPDFALARDNLGIAMLKKGREREAFVQFQKVLANDPGDFLANYNAGNILFQFGQVDEAMVHFQNALDGRPDFAPARDNLGIALLQKRREPEAVVEFQKALESDPDDPTAHYNLGIVFFQKGRVDEAIAHFRKAQETWPGFAEAHNNLGVALLQKGSVDEAIAQFQKVLEIRPDFADALDNLGNAAWLLATAPDASIRNGARALALAQQLDRLSGGNNPVLLDTLAAAYGETGRFPEAVDAAQRALELAQARNNTALADTLRRHVKLLQAGSSLRIPSQTNAIPGPNRR